MISSEVAFPLCESEIIWCQIKSGREQIFIATSYRPEYDRECIDEVRQQIVSLKKKYPKASFIVSGDFNCPEIDWKLWTGNGIVQKKLIDLANDFSLEQIVNFPTRGANLLDLILTDIPERVQKVEPLGAFGDHLAVTCSLRIAADQTYSKVKVSKQYHRADVNAINTTLEAAYTRFVENFHHRTLDQNWCFFRDTLLDLDQKFVPTRRVKGSHDKPWFTRNIKRDLQKVKRLLRRAKRSNLDHDWECYRCQNRKVKETMKAVKEEFLNSIAANCKTNPNSFWKLVRQLKNGSNGTPQLLDPQNDNITTDPGERAKLFNDYFQSVFKRSSDGTPPEFALRTQKVMPDILVTVNGIEKLIDSLGKNKPAGPDGIPAQLLKCTSIISAKFIADILNLSLSLGQVPVDWTKATIVPVHKKGPKELVQNYRPISLTSLVCKMLEHVIVSSVMSFLTSESLLSNRQFGFRKGASCELLLVDLIDKIAAGLENFGQVDLLALDWEKAFDSVDHSLLILKLEKYGICSQVVEWFRAFLKSRMQFVIVDGIRSSEGSVTSGVPQGSVCGPLLFLIYINDLLENLENEGFLFADDSGLLRPIRDINDQWSIQRDLDRIAKWCQIWRLNVNIGKCQYLRISRKKQRNMVTYNYTLEGKLIQQATSIRYLGITIDDKLSWNQHIEEITAKALKRIRFAGRIFKYAGPAPKVLAVNGLVKPILDYASAAWDPFQRTQVGRLEMVQRCAARMINRAYRKKICVTSLLNNLNWPSLEVRRTEGRLKLFHKIYHSRTIISAPERLVKPDFVGFKDHKRKLKLIVSRSDYYHQSFFPRTLREWNRLPAAVAELDSASSFTAALKNLRSPLRCSHLE